MVNAKKNYNHINKHKQKTNIFSKEVDAAIRHSRALSDEVDAVLNEMDIINVDSDEDDVVFVSHSPPEQNVREQNVPLLTLDESTSPSTASTKPNLFHKLRSPILQTLYINRTKNVRKMPGLQQTFD